MIQDKTKIATSGQSKYFLIPYEMFTDSQFPFKEDEELNIEIKGNKVVIEK